MIDLPGYISPKTAAGIRMQQMLRRWGNLNRYTCKRCGAELITTDLDTGTTPFATSCKQDGCKGFAQSECYQVPHHCPKPTHGWYRPSDEEFPGLSLEQQDHCLNGGLRLRPLTDEELAWLQ